MELTRRNFIQTAGSLGTLAAISSMVNPIESLSQDSTQVKSTIHKLPELPYKYDALEPHIDSKTVEIHHTKHHNAYVVGLNKAEEELAKARASGNMTLVDYWTKKSSFHGAGHFLHTLYWYTMAPNAGGQPKGKLAEKIKESFGSFDVFKSQLQTTAQTVEGSGWAVLGYRTEDKLLYIYQAEKHENLAPWNVVPILALDVWEHAYYLKYQNKRADYITAWWNVVNWDAVEKNLNIHK